MKDEKDLISDYIFDGKLQIEMCVEKYSNYVYTIINNNGYRIENEDIEEIISDVFFYLWNNQNKLDMNKKMSSYIAGITKNLIRKKYREIKNSNISDFEEKTIIAEGFEIEVEYSEQNALILKELEKMKKEVREIFMYFYYEQKSIKEISKLLNISESKVKMSLHRTRKRLKRMLNGEV